MGTPEKALRADRLYTITMQYVNPKTSLTIQAYANNQLVTSELNYYALGAARTPADVASITLWGGSGNYNIAPDGDLQVRANKIEIPARQPPSPAPGSLLTVRIIVTDNDLPTQTYPATLAVTVRYLQINRLDETIFKAPETNNRLIRPDYRRGGSLDITVPLTIWQGYQEGYSGSLGATLALVESPVNTTTRVVAGSMIINHENGKDKLFLLARRAYGAFVTATLMTTDGENTPETQARPDRFYTIVAAPILSIAAGIAPTNLQRGRGIYYYSAENPAHSALRKVARVSVASLPQNISLTAEIKDVARELTEWKTRGRGFYIDWQGLKNDAPLTIIYKDSHTSGRAKTLPYTLVLSLTNIAVPPLAWSQLPGFTPRQANPKLIKATLAYHANMNLHNAVINQPVPNDYFTPGLTLLWHRGDFRIGVAAPVRIFTCYALQRTERN